MKLSLFLKNVITEQDFASVKSLETYLSLNGYGNLDFSELHVDYLTSSDFGGWRALHDGGNFEVFEQYLSQTNGPVYEEEVPYNANYNKENYDYLLSLNNKAYIKTELEIFNTLLKRPAKNPKRVRRRQLSPKGAAVRKSSNSPDTKPVVSPDSEPLYTEIYITTSKSKSGTTGRKTTLDNKAVSNRVHISKIAKITSALRIICYPPFQHLDLSLSYPQR